MRYYFLSTIGTAIFLLALGLSSCKKDDLDKIKPTIKIISPKMNDTVSISKDSVHIEFNSGQGFLIQDIRADIKTIDGNIIFTENKTLIFDRYTYRERFFHLLKTELEPLVMTIKDSIIRGNTASESVRFYVIP